MTTNDPTAAIEHRTITIEPLSADGFAPFGTVIAPTEDGVPFGPDDAVLDLAKGTPRFYTMLIPGRGFGVSAITRHRCVTQALASAGGHEWVLAVAPPGNVDNPDAQPDPDQIRAFTIPGDTAIMMHTGTWHAGPLFAGDARAFFNLELADTNIVDHQSCHLDESFGFVLELSP